MSNQAKDILAKALELTPLERAEIIEGDLCKTSPITTSLCEPAK